MTISTEFNLKSSLDILFYVSKAFGLITYSWSDYYNSKIFKLSLIGVIYSCINLLHNSIEYHFATVTFSLGNEGEVGTLTVIIGVFIIYMEPIMMCIDIIASIINQKHLMNCLDRMQRVDDKLLRENIIIDYKRLRTFSIRLIFIITVCELSLVFFNFIQFQDFTAIESIWWFVTFVPLYLSSLSKIWFVVLVFNVKQKFQAINDYFDSTRFAFEKRKRKADNNTNTTNNKGKFTHNNNNNDESNFRGRNNLQEIIGLTTKTGKELDYVELEEMEIDEPIVEYVGYLHKEIQYPNIKPLNVKRNRNNNNNLQHRAFEISSKIKDPEILQVRPVITKNTRSKMLKKEYNDDFMSSQSPPPPPPSSTPPPPFSSIKSETSYFNDFLPFSDKKKLIIDDKLDKKITMLCHLHDEICEIGKMINQMYSFQMLLLMAYGFMCLTAQFYFVYCGMVRQVVPALFRSAESLWISVFYIVYTGAKCVFVIFISWQTKIDAQKTGVQIHKVANVIDEDHFYQTVNHLSLKLLNHQLNFTACGFFDLDMTTLYAITGAITSYLIILIQFNLAAQRNRKSSPNGLIGGNNTSVVNTTSPIID